MNECYECRWRGSVAGSRHSSCKHPETKEDGGMGELLSIFASAGRMGPAVNVDAAIALGITAKEHGIRMG